MAAQSTCKSALSCYALRLKPGEELYSSLLKCKNDNNLQAPFIMTCCGSLTKATLRLAAFSTETPDNVRYAQYRMFLSSLHTGVARIYAVACALFFTSKADDLSLIFSYRPQYTPCLPSPPNIKFSKLCSLSGRCTYNSLRIKPPNFHFTAPWLRLSL